MKEKSSTAIYQQRLSRIQKQLAEEGAALLLSAPVKVRQNRGVEYPFRQESDLYYLTGSHAEDITLLVSPLSKTPILFAPKADPIKVVWEGSGPNAKDLARKLKASLTVSDSIDQEVIGQLKNVTKLYYQHRSGTTGHRVATTLFNLDPYSRGTLPSQFVAADKLMAPFRLVKSLDEINLIKHAAAITNEALSSICPLARRNVTEAEIAETLEFVFRSCGAKKAFHTIVATGKNAATLHYHSLNARLKKGEMLLIDCGAEYEMYAADISRTLPIDGTIDPIQRTIYETVLKAQQAAIKAVRPGVKMTAPYEAAARVMIEGLKKLGILKGSSQSLLKSGAFRPYFPHGIGHSLGLEVHDVGELRGNNQAVLSEGMVVTIEPGLYFAKAQKKVPACGVRIEDDILVTKKGGVILSEGFPKDLDELSHLILSS